MLITSGNTNNILQRSADRANFGATPKACVSIYLTWKDKQLVFILLCVLLSKIRDANKRIDKQRLDALQLHIAVAMLPWMHQSEYRHIVIIVHIKVIDHN